MTLEKGGSVSGLAAALVVLAGLALIHAPAAFLPTAGGRSPAGLPCCSDPSVRSTNHSWDFEIADPDGGVLQAYTSLALDTAGQPRIAYYVSGRTSLNFALRNGAGWNLSIPDASSPDVGFPPSLALDTSDRPHIAYRDVTNRELRFAWSVDNKTWNFRTPDSAGSPGGVSLALDATGQPRIAYHALTGLNFTAWDGAAWNATTVDASSPGVGSLTSLAIDSSDRPHIAYFDATNADLKYAWLDAAGWNVTTVDSFGDVGFSPSLALDASDRPHVVYVNVTGGSLQYATLDGAVWTFEAVDRGNNTLGRASLALDPAGRPHIAYQAAASLNYSWRDAAGWNLETVDSSGDVGYSPSLALDAFGHPHISYFDYTNADLMYASGTPSSPPNQVPNASFTVSPTTGNVLTWFVADASSSTDPEDPSSLLEVRWDWEDDGAWDTAFMTTKITQHRYTAVGSYAIRMEVRDTGGLTNQTTRSANVVNGAPVANAGPDQQVYKNAVVVLDGRASYDPDGDPLTFLWNQTGGPDFPPIKNATLAVAHFVPRAAGVYTFQIAATDAGGTTGLDKTSVSVWSPQPMALLLASQPTAVVGASVSFDGSASSDPDGTIADYAFDFGDGTPQVSGPDPVQTRAFSTPGSYTVSLVVTDDDGNRSAPTTVQVFITSTANRPPTAVILATSLGGSVDSLITFDGSASTDDGAIVSYVWDFGDGTNGTGVVATHRFSQAGAFTVILTVTDDGGLRGIAQLSIPVNRAPGDSQPLDRPTDGTIIGAIIVVVGIIIAVLWRFRTSWLPHFLYWLYTKLRRDEVLDNFARGEIYAYLRLNPGDTYAQIKRNLHLAAGPLTYHLAVLEREGLIRSVMQGPRKHFYPADARIPEGGGDLHYIQARALHVLCEEPGMTVSDLAENLGVSRHVALYHLRKLVGADRVRLERKMARLRAYPVHRGAEARASAGR